MRSRELYRDKQRGKIAGVCSGVAEYFGLEVWLVRILTITAFLLLAGPFVLVAYVAAWFILDEKPSSDKVYSGRTGKGYSFSSASNTSYSETSEYSGKGYKNSAASGGHRVEVKAKVWQAGMPPRQAFLDTKQRYESIEKKLRKLESYVTSNEFQLNREISRL